MAPKGLKEKKSKFQKGIDKRELDSAIKLHIDEESRNIFQREVTRRHAMTRGGRRVMILAIVVIVLLLFTWILGNVAIVNGYVYIAGSFWNNSVNLADMLGGWRVQIADVLSMGLYARYTLMGFVAIILVGMAMACSGAVYQGVFQNPMASPTTLGVTSGGLLGGMIYILFCSGSGVATTLIENFNTYSDDGSVVVTAIRASDLFAIWDQMNLWQRYGQMICVVAGCFGGVALMVAISMGMGKGKINTLSLMLCGSIFGVVVNQVAQTVQYAILYNVGEDSTDVRLTALASLQGSSSSIGNTLLLDEFLLVAIPVGGCLALCFAFTGKLNVLVFGEEEARVMGLHVQRFRVVLIICCTAMTATVMVFCGQVSMLGFLMPHLARFFVGPDFKYLVPASALLGAVGCLIVANVCNYRGGYGEFNTYIGVFCSVASVFFILLYRRNRHADWA